MRQIGECCMFGKLVQSDGLQPIAMASNLEAKWAFTLLMCASLEAKQQGHDTLAHVVDIASIFI